MSQVRVTSLSCSCLAAIGALLFVSGCVGGAQQRSRELPDSDFVVPAAKPGMFLRVGFDDDPSDMIGRFLPDGLGPGEIDESQGMQTRCSQFITYKEVRAGGTYQEYFNASRGLKASLGVSGIGGASGGFGDDASLRVKYTLHKKMRAVVDDAAALDRCCTAAPGQCTELFLGEFLYGTGLIYQAVGAQDDFEAGASGKGVSAEIEYQDQVAWKRMTSFEDVYFAFKTQRHVAADRGLCDEDWVSETPTSLDGTYFVGVSAPSPAEGLAREAAEDDGRRGVLRYLGQFLSSASAGLDSVLEGHLEDVRTRTAMTEGITSRVQAKCWDVEKTGTAAGNRYVARVLVFLPKTQEEATARDVLGAIQKALAAQGKRDPEVDGALRDLKEEK